MYFRLRTAFGEEALAVIDPKAVQHILLHQAENSPKPADVVRTVGLCTRPGLLVVEGDDHRRQRKILTPCRLSPTSPRLWNKQRRCGALNFIDL